MPKTKNKKNKSPRNGKKGGRTSKQRYKNTGIKCYSCAGYPCRCK